MCGVDQWELSHLGGRLSGWLVNDIQTVQRSNGAQGIERLYRDSKADVPVPAGWTTEGP
ncbi:MAG TPA: hypothetical protein VFQ44_12160 [Streptosporangiaceae bacterium]|nr:hypothetical protein [Streptosporangiaceae bacterium]